MGTATSKCKANRISTKVRLQLLQLKSQRDELEHYIQLLQDNIAQTRDAAVLQAKKNQREQAVMLLRKRDLLNSQLTATREYLLQILAIISDIELAQTQVEVVGLLETGSKLLTFVTGKIKAAHVQHLMQIQADNIQELDVVAAALNVTCSHVDDSVLLQELNALVGTATEAPVRDTVAKTTLTPVATATPPQVKTEANAVKQERKAVLA